IEFISRKVFSCKKLLVRKSALFVNGPKASETFVFVTPHVDIPELVKEKFIIQEQLVNRQANIDFQKVENLWAVYEELKKQKSDYDKKKAEISQELGKLIKNEPDSDVTKKYKIQSDLAKENIKKLKVPLWAAEEAVMLEVLKLPNTLHEKTPLKEYQVIHSHSSTPNNNKDHLKIGREKNLINFKKNENYYLTGDAAIFELGAKFYFNNVLRNSNFIQFSNPDFVKSVIVEGCGEDHTDPDATFILHHNEDTKVNPDSRLHLTGGASLCSFFAYHAKNVLFAKSLPLNYFSMGRQYIPSPTEEDNLFHVSQASVVQIFNVTKDSKECDVSLGRIIEILKDAYTKLGYHYRIVLVPAHELALWESLRVVIEMYSSSMKKYVNVAEISVSGDFISKRLMLTYTENKESKYPHIISGTVLNVPKLLACAIEQDSEFSIPDMFKTENWSMKS
ncbi:serine--tRNA synthetase-like protein Slimp, partial [Leguminivora glycinivorella]|uniref:serine--tRNA synthetase-like protein Slimp n=1 Tax=Leguminivora glycinivorella TaxID=1035111 RepID=UPI0020101861